ncbi:MAG: M23 family metallopeptidase [Candidatus Neomarinimicrobiota bacterium]|nr:M23 family metallopeptidase [Candidatus Neomarinimicrobiota bacterium]
MLKRRKKISSRIDDHRYAFISYDDENGTQWDFSKRQLLIVVFLCVSIVGTGLFFATDYLTKILYQTKLKSLKRDYSQLSLTLSKLHQQMDLLSTHVVNIEEKDRALRTYANMPQIDKDVRKLGIGGMEIVKPVKVENQLSDPASKLIDLEMNVDNLTRKVKLELASYSNIYNKVIKESDRLQSIPSIRPVNGGYINSGFGYRNDPFTSKPRFHYGQDITVSSGTNIYAPSDGVVKYAARQGGFGKVIKLDHGYGYRTIFAHLSKFYVKWGQKVKRGDLIGKTGNTGRSAGPHLHYEVHRNGVPQNPLDYFFSGYIK